MSMWLLISFNAFTVLLWILSHVFFISFLFFLFFIFFRSCFLLMEFFFILFCIFGIFFGRFLICFQTVAKSKWLYFALYINTVCQPFWYCRKGKKGIYMWKKNKQHTKKCVKKKEKRFIGKGNKVLWIGTPFIYTKNIYRYYVQIHIPEWRKIKYGKCMVHNM